MSLLTEYLTQVGLFKFVHQPDSLRLLQRQVSKGIQGNHAVAVLLRFHSK